LGAHRTGRANDKRRRGGGENKNFHEFRLSDCGAKEYSGPTSETVLFRNCSDGFAA